MKCPECGATDEHINDADCPNCAGGGECPDCGFDDIDCEQCDGSEVCNECQGIGHEFGHSECNECGHVAETVEFEAE